MNKTVRVLVSFFLVVTDEASSASSTAVIHKEKFNVLLSDEHKELYRFQKHLKTCNGLERAKASEKSQKAPGHDC